MLPSPSLRDLIAAYEQQYATNARLRATMDAVIDFCVYADHADQPYSSDPLEAKVCRVVCVCSLFLFPASVAVGICGKGRHVLTRCMYSLRTLPLWRACV